MRFLCRLPKQNLFCLILLLFACTFLQAQDIDYLIKNATVYDGSKEQAPTQKNVGIKGDKIVFVESDLPDRITADHVIDAAGLVLAPGFIDPHTHNDQWVNSNDRTQRINQPSLSQGVTTVFIGSDGGGGFAVGDKIHQYNENGVGTNVALFVGFGPVRKAVLKNEDVKPDSAQLNQMKDLVDRAMKEGAFGLSTGLFYTPQSYASTAEVVELAKVAEAYGGIYDTHMRSESNTLMEAIQETLEIGRQTGIPLMISHIKALGPSAWGKSEEVIKMIEDAQEEGIKIFASQYPYDASHTSLKAMLIPQKSQAGGNARMTERLNKIDTDPELYNEISKNLAIRGGDSRIMISKCKDSSLIGKTLHKIASDWQMSPENAAVKIIKNFPGTSAVSFSMDQEDIVNLMKKDWVITGSDGGGGHPRTYGTFVRKIRKYALEDKVISLSDAIYRATGESATLLGLKNRGYIRKGYYADIVLFDPDEISDEATYEEPDRTAKGIHYVFVNGVLSVDHQKLTGQLGGRAIHFQQQ